MADKGEKRLRNYIGDVRRTIFRWKDRVSATVEAPIERADRFLSTGSAHLDDGLSRVVALRHKSPSPLLVMSLSAILVGGPFILRPGRALRFAAIGFATSGIVLYPDYVIRQVDALIEARERRSSSLQEVQEDK